MRSPRNETLRTDSILPTFRGIYLERFLHLVEGLDSLSPMRQRDAILGELAWCAARTSGTVDALKYRAMLTVLRDLLGQEWRVLFRQRSIFLARPDYSRGRHGSLDPAIVKAQIRDALREERMARLRAPSAVRFIESLESEAKGRSSIRDLIADGKELAASLSTLPDAPTPAEVRRVVRPYLQLIQGEERDVHSGLKLIDVWRYFRYLWSTPYLPTPGRNLYYLVRDAARQHHPVIGIGALGNSVVQLSDRDRVIGWSVEGVEVMLRRRSREIVRELANGSTFRRVIETEFLESDEEYKARIAAYATQLARGMAEALDQELSLISPTGLISKRELNQPNEKTIQRLLSIAAEAEKSRQDSLREHYEQGESPRRTAGGRSLQKAAQSPLFRRKRAIALAEVLFARGVFRAEGLLEDPLSALRNMLTSDHGRKALRIALHANKKTKIGTNMMEIIVCGAIPPYAELLGGKLVAMLMVSPQVVHEYAARYSDQASEIASQLAGRPIVRSADLVFVTTTSLYHVGSSQYERIKIPCVDGRALTYERIGYTEGYGSTVLSSESTDLLRRVSVELLGLRRVNNIFGEGVSPRLRVVREGLSLIGVPQTIVLKHSCPRIIYGVKLARNTLEYLRGEAQRPEYLFSHRRFREGTDEIIDFWLKRWLVPRARRSESLQRVSAFLKEDILVGRELREEHAVVPTAIGGADGYYS
jgi:hypothetical protein